MGLKLVKLKDVVGRTIHQCCICGKTGLWDKNWNWYGSLRELDDGKKIDKVCSEECKDSYNKKHHIPMANRRPK